MKDHIYTQLSCFLSHDRIKQKERLEYYTSLHIGGEADYLVTPSTVDEIKQIIEVCKRDNMPYYIMGNGSNILASDHGFRGLIIKLGNEFSNIQINEDGYIKAQAGVLLSTLANEAAKQSFTGFEFAAGIPGSLGGAVYMNAGAYDGEMKQCLSSATVMDDDGNIVQYHKDDLQLGYRSSILQKNKLILLEAELKLEKGDKKFVFDKIEDFNQRRREKQPLEEYSAGSTFKRPQGYYAGKLIHDAGLRGYQVGGAAVSKKHCGFVINKNNATAEEFKTVIQDVIRIVQDKYGVTMEPEVRFLGEFFTKQIEITIRHWKFIRYV